MWIVKAGVLPCVPAAAPVGERHVTVRPDASLIVEADGSQIPARSASGDVASAAIGRLYAAFYAGDGDVPVAGEAFSSPGAAFNVTRETEQHVDHDNDLPVDVEVLRIDSAALVVPFAYPKDFVPAKVVLSTMQTIGMSPGAVFNVYLADGYLTSLTADQLTSPGLYDGDGSQFRLLGTIDQAPAAGSELRASFDLPATNARVGTIVITGWIAPDRYDLNAGGRQGTGPVAFLPDIKITD